MGLTLDETVEAARRRLVRLTADQAHEAMSAGALLIDVRSQDERRQKGVIPGSFWYPRNVLEWRVHPTSPSHDEALGGLESRLMLLCEQGFQTSLAAVGLHDLGLLTATDVIDGFEGWAAAGLPVVPFDPARHTHQGAQ